MSRNEEVREVVKNGLTDFQKREGRIPSVQELSEATAIGPGQLRSKIRRMIEKQIEKPIDSEAAFVDDLRRVLMTLAKSKDREPKVLVLDEDGVEIGFMSFSDANALATSKDQFLHLVDTDSNPPVAQLMDHDRFKFLEGKKGKTHKRIHKNTRVAHTSELKEIRVSAKIEEKDCLRKIESARAFLVNGERVRISTMLTDGELQTADVTLSLYDRILDALGDITLLEEGPQLEGKTISMVLSPA